MFKNYTRYDPTTGRILSFGSCPANLWTGAEENWVDGQWLSRDYYVDPHSKTVTLMPKQPTPAHVFNWQAKEWFDPRTLRDLKDARRAVINAAREQAEVGGFEALGHHFDSDAKSVARINVQVQMALVALAEQWEFSIDWTLSDNSVVTLSGSQMISVGSALAEHMALQHEKAKGLKTQIEAAQLPEQVALVSWL